MVREDGLSYYAVVRDDELMQQAYDHTWLRKNVLTSLPVHINDDGDLAWDARHPDWKNVKTRSQIAEDVKHFISDTSKPELWAYYAAYDHVALCQLFGTMISLPNGIPMWSHDLMQEIERAGNPGVPQQESGEHNALEDAKWNMNTYNHLQRLLGTKDRLVASFYSDI